MRGGSHCGEMGSNSANMSVADRGKLIQIESGVRLFQSNEVPVFHDLRWVSAQAESGFS